MAENLYFGLSHQVVEILLRLPPLYVMDAILVTDLSLSFWSKSVATTTTVNSQKVRLFEPPQDTGISPEETQQLIQEASNSSMGLDDLYHQLYGSPDGAVLSYLMGLFVAVWLYLASAFVITLNLRHLLIFYAYFLALITIPLSCLSHYMMCDTLHQLLKDSAPENAEWFLHRYFSTIALPNLIEITLHSKALFANYVVQSVLSLIFCSVLRFHFDSHSRLLKVVTVSQLSPIALAFFGLPLDMIEWASMLSLSVPLFLGVIVLSHVMRGAVKVVINTIRTKRQFVNNFGLNTFLENEWLRLRVPTLLRTFWLTRIALHIVKDLPLPFISPTNSEFDLLPVETSAFAEQVGQLGKDAVTSGANTIIAVLGMTSIVSAICHYIGTFFYLVLSAEEEDEKSVASVSAVLFFVLALQTGLTSLEPDKRFARICKNLCLLLTALFHFIHNMVSPVLMSLSASHNYNSKKHLRALFICIFLVVAPILLMSVLWQKFTVGTWLLAVSAFCIEVIVKVAVTVSVYLLFLYDQYYQAGTWELMDDSVYMVKAVGNSVEFCFAVFLFFNGGWILLFESGGTIRAVMMLIHAYCNIWLEAKSGWQTFMKRRTAVAKINSLPDATPEQLVNHNDVCAICYQGMTSAKLTRCRHFFHGVCLRKWLYVQDTCPLCHGTLYNKGNLIQDGSEDERVENDVNADNNGENEIIDNDDLEDEDLAEMDTEDEEELGEVGEEGADDQDRVGEIIEEDDSSSENDGPSDNDLIYDSMEDFGESSGGELDQNNGQ